MKLMLLAATALLAAPVVAQDTTAPMQDAPATTMEPTMQPGGTQPTGDAMGADTATPAPSGQMTGGTTGGMSAPMPSTGAQTTGSGTPAGGYQPSTPAMAPGAPGAPVVFQPSQSPSQAFPPPPPQESYPICKKGQYDKCRQRGGK